MILSFDKNDNDMVDEATKDFFNEYGEQLPEHFFRNQIAGSMDLFRERLEPLMLNTVDLVHKNGFQQCIASGSPVDRVNLCVEVAKMRPYFPENNIFTRELVKLGKPAPDLFLHTGNVNNLFMTYSTILIECKLFIATNSISNGI